MVQNWEFYSDTDNVKVMERNFLSVPFPYFSHIRFRVDCQGTVK